MSTTLHDTPVETMAESLRFLSDCNRLRIVLALTRAETCVCDLIDELGIPQSLVSYHLGKLRRSGLVRARRKAQWVYYSLDPDAWQSMVAPLTPLLQPTPLPQGAAWGASDRCDLVPADPEHGACSGDGCC